MRRFPAFTRLSDERKTIITVREPTKFQKLGEYHIDNIQGATEDLLNEVNGDTVQLEKIAKDFCTLLLKKSQELTE